MAEAGTRLGPMRMSSLATATMLSSVMSSTPRPPAAAEGSPPVVGTPIVPPEMAEISGFWLMKGSCSRKVSVVPR